MFTADQIVAHLVGDYIIQSDWMANEKTKRSLAAAVHAVTYTLPFLFLTQSIAALAFIAGTHFVIDRWRLARFVVRWKNQISNPHNACIYETATGYPDTSPPFLAVWLLIIADNTLHLLCNGAALRWLA
jgi:hypothetical protein